MPLAVLEKEIETLPAESMTEIMDYIQYLKFKYNNDSKIDVSKRFGSFPELQAVPSDIDFCNNEIAEMFEV